MLQENIDRMIRFIPNISLCLIFWFYFFFKARRQILSIHTKDWNPKLLPQFINSVADLCVGMTFFHLKYIHRIVYINHDTSNVYTKETQLATSYM